MFICTQAEMIAAKSGVKLPADFVAAAMASGLSETALLRYIDLQVPPMCVVQGYRYYCACCVSAERTACASDKHTANR